MTTVDMVTLIIGVAANAQPASWALLHMTTSGLAMTPLHAPVVLQPGQLAHAPERELG
jgi:hypothetical protein